jgi:hypothetical protein
MVDTVKEDTTVLHRIGSILRMVTTVIKDLQWVLPDINANAKEVSRSCVI